MSVHSAGLLPYRIVAGQVEVMLVHPGGPFWARKDAGAWSIPKGLCEAGETPLAAARREFTEETGFKAQGPFHALGELKQPSGKIVHAWAVEQDIDTAQLVSNTFTLEWPPNSGVLREYPEVDAGRWFSIEEAGRKIQRGQAGFIDRLTDWLARQESTPPKTPTR